LKYGIQRFLSAKSGTMAVIQTAFANLAVQAVNLLCGILTARSLGPDGRGLLAAIIMWPQFLAYGMTVGIPIASVYWLKRRPDLSAELAGTGLLLSIGLGLLAALVGVAVIPHSLHTYPAPAIHLAQSWALVTPLELLAVTLIAQAQAVRFRLAREVESVQRRRCAGFKQMHRIPVALGFEKSPKGANLEEGRRFSFDLFDAFE